MAQKTSEAISSSEAALAGERRFQLPNPQSTHSEQDFVQFARQLVLDISGEPEQETHVPSIGTWLLDKAVLMSFTMNAETAQRFAFADEREKTIVCSMQTRSRFGELPSEKRRQFRYSFYASGRAAIYIVNSDRSTLLFMSTDWTRGINFLLDEVRNILDDLGGDTKDLKNRISRFLLMIDPPDAV